MTLARGSRGEHVLALQRLLLRAGATLPRWGADGELGAETLAAVNRLLAGYSGRGIAPDGVVTPEEVAVIERLAAAREAAPSPALTPDLDLTRQTDPGDVVRLRPIAQVTRLVLHQTACVLGESPARWLGVAVHAGVTRAGRVLYLHPPEHYLYAANGFNRSSVSLEIDGHFAGIAGDLRTYWRPRSEPDRKPLTLSAPQVDGAKKAILFLLAEVARRGGRITELVAHRQSSIDRVSDPGSEIWRALAPWCRDGLGLGTPLALTYGDGKPIPREWDDNSNTPY